MNDYSHPMLDGGANPIFVKTKEEAYDTFLTGFTKFFNGLNNKTLHDFSCADRLNITTLPLYGTKAEINEILALIDIHSNPIDKYNTQYAYSVLWKTKEADFQIEELLRYFALQLRQYFKEINLKETFSLDNLHNDHRFSILATNELKK